MEKVNFNISLPVELRDKLDEKREQERPPRSRSDYIAWALYRFFEEQERKPKH